MSTDQLPIPPELVGYTGAKSQSGVYQFIINHIPAHNLRAELFLGSGIISSKIGYASGEVICGSDLDEAVIQCWNKHIPSRWMMAFEMDYLKLIHWISKYYNSPENTFLFADPPYLKCTRHSSVDLYRKEFSEQDHLNFLTHAKFWPHNVMISHYPCQMYDDMLQGWARKEFTSQTRGGAKTDCIYMNYNISKMKLHTARYVGDTYTKRQMIHRKAGRWKKELHKMSAHERQYIIEFLQQPDKQTP